MLIIPNKLTPFLCVQDTEALNSDLNELSLISEQSLMLRSNPSQLKTWLKRWNGDLSNLLQSGRISRHSHSISLLEKWTSLLGDSRASRSPLPENRQEQTIQDTCSPTYSRELEHPDLFEFFSKTSKDSYQANSKGTDGTTRKGHRFCSMSYGNWNEWVTRQRLEYSARKKPARPIDENEFLSWPTMTVDDSKNNAGASQFNRLSNGKTRGLNLNASVVVHSLPAPDNASTNGSRQGSCDWPTARTSDAEGGRIKTEMNENGFRSKRVKSDQWFGAKLRDAVEAHEENNWTTPKVKKGADCPGERRQNSPNLEVEANITDGNKKKKLNPRWVETLMNIPIGWTMPSCDKLNDPAIYDQCDNRTDELRLCGNGVVPATAAMAFATLKNELEKGAEQ